MWGNEESKNDLFFCYRGFIDSDNSGCFGFER